jgi:transcription elongation factor Elf1
MKRKPKDIEVNHCPMCGSEDAEFYKEHEHIWKVVCRACSLYFMIWARRM